MREIIPPGVSGKQYHVYPPEIIQTNSLGRLRKNHWNAMNPCM